MTNFESMSTKKLKALLETESPENVELINNVLNQREGVKTQADPAAYSEEPTPLTDAEQAAIDAAEARLAEAGNSPAPTTKVTTLSIAECEALAATLQANVGNRCEVLPFNEIEWVAGQITGVHVEKRANKVLYIIKGDNGKRMMKAHDAKGIKISEEKREIVKKAFGRTVVSGDKATSETLTRDMAEAAAHVGEFIEIIPFGSTDKTRALIVGLVAEKRVNKVLLRVELEGTEVEVEGTVQKVPGKIIHKMYGSNEIAYTGEFDNARREAYMKRVDSIATRASMTPQEKAVAISNKIKKIAEEIEAKNAALDLLKQELASVEAEIENASAENAPTAQTADDLM